MQAVVRHDEDIPIDSTPWGAPAPGKETVKLAGEDFPVLQERRLEKSIKMENPFAPDYSNLFLRVSLIEKSDTKIRIKETHVTTGAPYVDTFEVWVIWDIITPDPLSSQVVFRKLYYVNWFDKPFMWRTVLGFVIDGTVEFNELLPPFF